MNAVAPGPIGGTEGMARLAPGREAAMATMVPLGRLGMPDEVAAVVLFLCSPARTWITGSTVVVGGGAALVGASRLLGL